MRFATVTKNERSKHGFILGLGLLLVASVALPAAAFAAPAEEAKAAGLPPLIDRESFFGDPEIAGAQLSPDGKFIAFIKPYKETRNIWIKKTEQPFDAARPITADTTRPIPGYFWSRDGRFILFVQDQGGDENYNIHAVNPAAAPPEGKDVPQARNLTDRKGARAMIYAVPKTDPDLIYVGLNDRDASWHDLYRLKISTGELTLVRQNTERVSSWVFDNKGELRLAVRVADNGDTEVLRVDAEGKFTKVYSCDVFESCGPVRFDKDNKRVYMVTNKGVDVDLAQLILLDPVSGQEKLVESDPEKRVDFGGAIFSDLSDELLGTSYEDERTRIYWRDKTWEADYKLLTSKLPGKDISLGSVTKDENLMLIAAGSDVEPGERHLFDRKTKQLTFQYRVFDKLPREQLAPMTAISYKSADGLQIPAFLTLPKGVPPKNLPAVVVPHGGPWYRDSWGYDPLAQFYANRGYAVLQPNFRGSTGYGKKFLNAGNKEWGQKMQDDITWGVKHLVTGGIADPKRVAIMGGSYGGYATLAGVTFTPDLYAAAVSLVGPSNLITFLDSIPPYWEAARKIFNARLGDPSTPEGKARLERQSPLNSAQKIKTPLLVVQGANDPRVKKAESDQIVVALRDRGFPVEYLVAPDEGHGFARPVNNMAWIAVAEKFLAKYLGGRYQESMTPDVAKRLAEITVDPKTVSLKPKVDAASVGRPKPIADLAAGSSKFQSNIETGDKTIPVDISREIKEEGGQWVVTDSVASPMGASQDRTTLDKSTLAVRKRTLTQGPVTIDLVYDENKVSGSFTMGSAPKPIEVDLGGPAFAEGAGWGDVIARLPLAEGYAVSFRNFDIQTQKPRIMQLKVAGVETVTVAAGSFEAYKVEIAEAEGAQTSTLWIDRDTRKLVKSIQTLPQMGGALVTTELLP